MIEVAISKDDLDTYDSLIWTLSEHCGERGITEGAIETLKRIIAERNACAKMLFGPYAPPWKQLVEKYG